jgi:phage/plasmid-like protein (TIGR03299 family)
VKLPRNARYEDIVQAAGFYSASKTELFTREGVQLVDRFAVIRDDTRAPLAVVTGAYAVIQFADVAKALVEAASGIDAVFHTAGTLGPDGARGWMLAELPKVIRVKGDDSEIRPYLLGTVAHDGHSPVVLKNIATRVVCQNTLNVAMGEASKFSVAVRHTRYAEQLLASAVEGFKLLVQGYSEFEAMANHLALTRMSDKQFGKTIDDLLPVKGDEPTKQQAEKRELVKGLFDTAIGLSPKIKGTAWAAVQAWTEFADHHRVVRDDADGAKRLESVWLGAAADIKQAAFTSIVKRAAGAAA